MLTKATERLIQKLKQKKQRYLLQLFVAEGEKTIKELINAGFAPKHLLVSDHRFESIPNRVELPMKEFKNLSSLETADGTLAVFEMPKIESKANENVCLILDNIRIPGNLGTIIRTADWFGVKEIFCTKGTTDAYNAKCVQSSMGSIGRVKITYAGNEEIYEHVKDKKLLCADMEGTNLKLVKPTANIALVMGSESHGPSDFWKEQAETITIQKHPHSETESLNVGIATAICLQHFS